MGIPAVSKLGCPSFFEIFFRQIPSRGQFASIASLPQHSGRCGKLLRSHPPPIA
jgi:hypothetical protein